MIVGQTLRNSSTIAETSFSPSVENTATGVRPPSSSGSSASRATITLARVRNDSGGAPKLHQPGEPLVFEFDAEVEPKYRDVPLAAGFAVETEAGMRVFTVLSSRVDTEIFAPDGRLIVRCEIPDPPLVAGRYLLSAFLTAGGEQLGSSTRAVSFEIAPAGVFLDPPLDPAHGPVAVDFKFEVGGRDPVSGERTISGPRP
jgi:hypothetical protein